MALCMHVRVCIPVYIYNYMTNCLPIYLSTYLPIYLSTCLLCTCIPRPRLQAARSGAHSAAPSATSSASTRATTAPTTSSRPRINFRSLLLNGCPECRDMHGFISEGLPRLDGQEHRPALLQPLPGLRDSPGRTLLQPLPACAWREREREKERERERDRERRG